MFFPPVWACKNILVMKQNRIPRQYFGERGDDLSLVGHCFGHSEMFIDSIMHPWLLLGGRSYGASPVTEFLACGVSFNNGGMTREYSMLDGGCDHFHGGVGDA